MKLRTQLLVLAAIPISGVMLVSGIGLKNGLATLDRTSYVEQTIARSVLVGDLIHELQVERGMSAGFIGSGGVNFSAELPDQRARVDTVITAFESTKDYFEGLPENRYAPVQQALSGVMTMRSQVDAGEATVPQMAGVYTSTIQNALDMREYALARIDVGSVGRIAKAITTTSHAKESAGLERAMGAVGFGAGKFPEPVRLRFKQLGAKQTAFLASAQFYLPPSLADTRLLDLPELQAVMEKRAIVERTGGDTTGQGVTAPAWFRTSTDWIERLRQVERDASAAARQEAAQVSSDALSRVWIYLISMVAAILISVLVGWRVIRKLTHGVSDLSNAMESIAHRDFSVRLSSFGAQNEIGDLSRALARMRDDLKDADVKLGEAYNKSFAFEGSDAAMVVMDPELHVTALNHAATLLFEEFEQDFATVFQGFSGADVLGRSLDGLMGPDVDMRSIMNDRAQLPWRGDIDLGKLKVELNIAYIESEQGGYAGNVLQLRDVSLVRTRHGIVAAINRDQSLVDLSMDGQILRANALFCEAIGSNEPQLVGKKFNALLLGDSVTLLRSALDQVARGQSATERLHLRGGDGSEVWLRATINPVLDGNGTPVRIIVIAENITEGVLRFQADQAAREQDEAERARIVSQLGIGLSHIADGNLSYRIGDPFDGSFDALRKNFNLAVEQLAEVMEGVTTSLEKLRYSSSELKSASGSLAQRTESQAATLEETSASLDQITNSVGSTATEVREADKVVQGARDDAQRGGQTVQDAVKAMELISQSSEQIFTIVQVIDDISFQTNLLALNAGIEAARAGEAGRGFAVVASEVRALAQRAADAAKQIGDLISESKTHVDHGVGLVDETGTVLVRIAEQVVTASDRVTSIRQATDDQAHALSEINSAVSSLEQNTQQNAAMVEEATALGTALSGDADELASLVDRFSLKEGHNETAAQTG